MDSIALQPFYGAMESYYLNNNVKVPISITTFIFEFVGVHDFQKSPGIQCSMIGWNNCGWLLNGDEAHFYQYGNYGLAEASLWEEEPNQYLFHFSSEIQHVDYSHFPEPIKLPWDMCQLPLKMTTLDLGAFGSDFSLDLRPFKDLTYVSLDARRGRGGRDVFKDDDSDDWYEFADWSYVWFPDSLEVLSIHDDKFDQDLRYLKNLEKVDICNQHLDNWDSVRFPESLEELHLDFTNFHSTLHYLPNLKFVMLQNTYPNSWDNVWFPESLEELHLDHSNFNQDLSYLPSLKLLSLVNATNLDFDVVKFPESLQELNLQDLTVNGIDFTNLPHLETLTLNGSSSADWTLIQLPASIKDLLLDESDFDARLDYLQRLEKVTMRDMKETRYSHLTLPSPNLKIECCAETKEYLITRCNATNVVVYPYMTELS